jgi:SprT protein
MNLQTDKKLLIANQIKKFVPEGFETIVANLIILYPVQFKIVNPRATKLGDYRPSRNGLPHRITVNGDLNPYSFLITTIHEFAHLVNYIDNGRKVAPHGEEWKNHFRKLLLPIIDTKLLPKDVEISLVNSLVKMKASSCSDIQLSRVLKNYDKKQDDYLLLEELPINTKFNLQGKLFIKGPLRRKRFICEEIQTKKKYLIYAIAEVIPIFDN